LELSAHTLTQLLELSGFGCWEWDTSNSIIRFDNRWARALGYTKSNDSLEFPSWDMLVHPDDIQRLRTSLEAMLSGASSGSVIDYRILTASGNYIWILDRAVAGSLDDSGRASLAVGYQMDINQDRLADERLLFQRKLGSAISSSADYREALAGTLNILVELPPFDDGAALAPDADTGELEPVIQGTTGSTLMDALAGYRSSEHPICRASCGAPVYFSPMPGPEGGIKDTDCACVLPVEFDGEVIATFLFTSSTESEVPLHSRDVLGTVSRWIGRALSMVLNVQHLEHMYEQARRDSESREELLREVNHRVKNNLAAIVGLLYAEQRFLDSEQSDIWKPIQQDLICRIQGLALVHSMLSASRWSPLPISELVQRILDSTLKALPAGKQLHLSVSPSRILLRSDQAHQFGMLMNELATNTLKYVVPHRDLIEVKVDIEAVGERVIITYRDNGLGFPDDVLSLERHNLGLELVRNILRSLLGGEITLRNDEGAIVELNFSRKRIEED